MSFTLKLDPLTHDLNIGDNGKFKIVSGSDEVRQRVKVALYHYQGEYFLNTPNGVPWHDGLLGLKGNKNTLSNTIRKKILEVPGVIRIIEFRLTYDSASRSYSPYAKIVVARSDDEGSDLLTIDGLYVEA